MSKRKMNKKIQIACALACFCAALAKSVVGGGVIVQLPEGYTHVEYVQGDGTAYVDLKAKFSNLDAIDAVVLIPTVESAMIFGSRTDSVSADWDYCGLDEGNGQVLNLGIGSWAFKMSVSSFGSRLLNHRVRIQASKESREITDLDGLTVERSTGWTGNFETSYDMTLFAGRGGLWTDKRFKGRIYKFTVRRSGVPRFVLVPCKNQQGQIGFFDAVSGTFFGNAEESGGAFVAGPVCTSNYSDVDVPFDCYVDHKPVPGVYLYAPVGDRMERYNVSRITGSDADLGIGHSGVASFTYSDGAEEKTVGGVITLSPMDPSARLCQMEGEFLQGYPVQGGQPPEVKGIVVRDLAGNVITDYTLEYYGYGQSGKATVAVRLADGRLGWAEQIDVWDIPEDYVPVEYVQGDGAAAINLGFQLSSADTVYVWAMVKEAGGQHVYGGRSAAISDSFLWSFNGADDYCVLDYYANGKGRFSMVGIYDAFVGKKVMAQNGAALRGFFDASGNVLTSGGRNLSDTTTASATFTCGVNCGLFTASGQVWSAPNFNGRIYEFRVVRNGVNVHALMPCVRKADQEIGFYDAVTGDFHVNTAGAGAFAVPEYRLRVSPIPDQVVTMGAATPKPEVSFLQNGDFVPLAEGRDYELSYSGNAGLGLAQVTVKGIGEFAGLLVTSEFRIVSPANPQVFLVGDFSLRSHWPKRKLYLKDYRVVDADGNDVGPFTICSVNDRETGDATVKAQVTSGPYAGAIAARVQPIVVVPNGYTPVEYVQGDGVAAIDLGFKLSSADTVEIWAMLKEQGGQLIYGARTDHATNDSFLWSFNGADDTCILDFCNGGLGRLAKTNVYDAFVGKKILARDGAMVRGFFDIYGNGLVSGGVELVDPTWATTSFACGVTCGLFTAHGDVATTWTASNFNGRIYSFSVTRTGEPFLTLVPCIEDATGEVGFYDAVGRRFVRKTTEAGAFTAGPPVRCVKSGLVFALY